MRWCRMTDGSLAQSQDVAQASLPVHIADPRFTLSIDPKRRHLRIVTNGLWNPEVARNFAAGLDVSIRALVEAGAPYGRLRTLIDPRAASIMPQELVDMLQSLAVTHGPASERIAILSGSVLQKLQYRRIAPQPVFGHFLDETDALAWLYAD
jgi:hypothetical protein